MEKNFFLSKNQHSIMKKKVPNLKKKQFVKTLMLLLKGKTKVFFLLIFL